MKYLFVYLLGSSSWLFCLSIYVFFTIFARIMRRLVSAVCFCLISWIGATKIRTRR